MSAAAEIKAVVVESHPVLRASLEMRVREVPGVRLLGAFGPEDVALRAALRTADAVVLGDGAVTAAHAWSGSAAPRRRVLVTHYRDLHPGTAARFGLEAVVEAGRTDELTAALHGRLVSAGKVALSNRERQLMHCTLTGCPLKGIAANLGISLPTAYAYRRRALVKLGFRSLAEFQARQNVDTSLYGMNI